MFNKFWGDLGFLKILLFFLLEIYFYLQRLCRSFSVIALILQNPKRRWGKVSVESWTRGRLVPCLGWAGVESRQGRKCASASTSCESTNQSQSHMPLSLSGPGHVFSCYECHIICTLLPTLSLFLPLLYMFSAFHLMTCWSIVAELWGNQFFTQVTIVNACSLFKSIIALIGDCV